MNAQLKPWQGTTQQILIGLAMALVIVAMIEANSDDDQDCGWSFMGRDVSHYGQGDLHKIRIGRGRCRIDVDLRGDVDFLPDNRGVARLGAGASLRIKQKLRRERRRLDVERGSGGAPEYTWYVNSLPRSFDDQARDWLSDVLPGIYRSSGLDADGRVRHLWSTGGFDAVMKEIEEIESRRVRATYLREVLASASDDGELVRALDFARRGIASDHEMRRSLAGLAPASLRSPPVREAWVAALSSIDSDYELRQALTAALAEGDVDAEVLDALLTAALTVSSDHEQARLLVEVAQKVPAEIRLPASYVRALESIGTDHEHKRTLMAALARPGLSGEEAAELLATARRISSDFELAEVLAETARLTPRERPLPPPFYEALRAIDSDEAARRVLSTAVETRDLDPTSAVALLEAARSVSSDFELTTFLAQLIDAYPIGEELPEEELERVLRTVDSEGERQKVDHALEARRDRGSRQDPS